MYAHVTDDVVDSVGLPPDVAFDGERWWDLRELDPEGLAATDWYLVEEAPKPPDTETTIFEGSFVFDGDGVAQVWTEVPKTPEQVQVEAVAAAQAELDRAVALNSAPEELQALQEAILASEGIEDGDPWRQPTGAHDAYPLGAVVSHKDKTWESTVAANVWEPGVSGWLESGPGIPDWVQPTGAHDAYPKDAEVWHIEKLWKSNVDGNVWEPPEQWTQLVGANIRKTLRRRS